MTEIAKNLISLLIDFHFICLLLAIIFGSGEVQISFGSFSLYYSPRQLDNLFFKLPPLIRYLFWLFPIIYIIILLVLIVFCILLVK